jgi:hypothetical protein
LRDRAKKPISHFGGLEVENLAVRMREVVPQRRNSLGRMPHSPLSTLVTREEDWEEEALVTVEKERDGEEAMVRGFKHPRICAWPDIVWADPTLPKPGRLCLARTLCPGGSNRLGKFSKNESFNGLC